MDNKNFYYRRKMGSKVKFYVDTQNIKWDGTIAFMIAEDGENKPEPCAEKYTITIQNVR